MKYLLLVPVMFSIHANALVCLNDASCLSKTLTLVKQAKKLGYCSNEVKAIQALGVVKIQTELKGSELPNKLELCVAQAKENVKLLKKAEKIQAKLNDTFNTPKAR